LTTPTRQQSLEAARRAAHFLKLYIQTEIVDERLRAEIACLLEEFERLDEQERTKQTERSQAIIALRQTYELLDISWDWPRDGAPLVEIIKKLDWHIEAQELERREMNE
jgi:hypothetical protein